MKKRTAIITSLAVVASVFLLAISPVPMTDIWHGRLRSDLDTNGWSILGLGSFSTTATPKDIYFLPRTDGLPGSGKISDPWNATGDLLDRKLHDYFVSGQTNLHVHLLGGNYLSAPNTGSGDTGERLWYPKTGWEITGEGRDVTFVKFDHVYSNPDPHGNAKWAIPYNEAYDNIKISGLTFDCNFPGLANDLMDASSPIRTITTTAAGGSDGTITASGGAFTVLDLRRRIIGTGIPANSWIGVVVDSTHIKVSSSPVDNIPVDVSGVSNGASLTIKVKDAALGALELNGSHNTVENIGVINGYGAVREMFLVIFGSGPFADGVDNHVINYRADSCWGEYGNPLLLGGFGPNHSPSYPSAHYWIGESTVEHCTFIGREGPVGYQDAFSQPLPGSATPFTSGGVNMARVRNVRINDNTFTDCLVAAYLDTDDYDGIDFTNNTVIRSSGGAIGLHTNGTNTSDWDTGDQNRGRNARVVGNNIGVQRRTIGGANYGIIIGGSTAVPGVVIDGNTIRYDATGPGNDVFWGIQTGAQSDGQVTNNTLDTDEHNQIGVNGVTDSSPDPLVTVRGNRLINGSTLLGIKDNTTSFPYKPFTSSATTGTVQIPALTNVATFPNATTLTVKLPAIGVGPNKHPAGVEIVINNTSGGILDFRDADGNLINVPSMLPGTAIRVAPTLDAAPLNWGSSLQLTGTPLYANTTNTPAFATSINARFLKPFTLGYTNSHGTFSAIQVAGNNSTSESFLGFYGSSPIAKPTGNLFTALSNLGLVVSPTLANTDITGLGTASTYTAGSGAGNVPVLDGAGKIPVGELPTSSLTLDGVWNANTNSPSLSNGSGTNNHYYIVNVAGSTSLDGVSSWAVGDWVLATGGAWTKVPLGTGSTTVTAANISDSTTVGQNLIKLANPSAISFIRINADNTATARSAANFKADLLLDNVDNTHDNNKAVAGANTLMDSTLTNNYIIGDGSGSGSILFSSNITSVNFDPGVEALFRNGLGLGTIATQAGTGTSTALQRGNGTGGFAPGTVAFSEVTGLLNLGSQVTGTLDGSKLSGVYNNLPISNSGLTYGATVNINFNGASIQLLQLAGDVTFTTTNAGVGKSVLVVVTGDSSTRTMTYPATWIPIGSALTTTLPATKKAVIGLTAVGTGDGNVLASVQVQP